MPTKTNKPLNAAAITRKDGKIDLVFNQDFIDQQIEGQNRMLREAKKMGLLPMNTPMVPKMKLSPKEESYAQKKLDAINKGKTAACPTKGAARTGKKLAPTRRSSGE